MRRMWPSVLAGVACGIVAVAAPVGAQENAGNGANGANGANGESAEAVPAASAPTVFAFFLRGEGNRVLDPFGSEGRREVLQLMMLDSPERGQFARVRLDEADEEGAGRQTGWYEIRGAVITLYHMDDRGATGRVEHGRYMNGRICIVDGTSGRTLAYEFMAPEGVDLTPPPSEGAPSDGDCDDEVRSTS